MISAFLQLEFFCFVCSRCLFVSKLLVIVVVVFVTCYCCCVGVGVGVVRIVFFVDEQQ